MSKILHAPQGVPVLTRAVPPGRHELEAAGGEATAEIDHTPFIGHAQLNRALGTGVKVQYYYADAGAGLAPKGKGRMTRPFFAPAGTVRLKSRPGIDRG